VLIVQFSHFHLLLSDLVGNSLW